MCRRLSSWSGASGRCSTGALSQAGSPPHLLTNGKPESSEATGPGVVAAWREQNLREARRHRSRTMAAPRRSAAPCAVRGVGRAAARASPSDQRKRGTTECTTGGAGRAEGGTETAAVGPTTLRPSSPSTFPSGASRAEWKYSGKRVLARKRYPMTRCFVSPNS